MRNFLLSGCLFFPLEATCLPVPWRISPEEINSNVYWIKSWARAPGLQPEVVLNSNRWFLPWLENILDNPEVVSALVLLCTTFIFMLVFRKAYFLFPVWVLVFTLIGLVFWFVSAPDLRFGNGYLWSIVLTGLAVGLTQFKIPVRLYPILVMLAAALACFLLFLTLALRTERVFEWPTISQPVYGVQRACNIDIYYPLDDFLFMLGTSITMYPISTWTKDRFYENLLRSTIFIFKQF